MFCEWAGEILEAGRDMPAQEVWDAIRAECMRKQSAFPPGIDELIAVIRSAKNRAEGERQMNAFFLEAPTYTAEQSAKIVALLIKQVDGEIDSAEFERLKAEI